MDKEGGKKKKVPEAQILAGQEIGRLVRQTGIPHGVLAERMGIDARKLSDLIHCRKKLDASLVKQLSIQLGRSEGFFWDLERTFELQLEDEAKSRQANNDSTDGAKSLAQQPSANGVDQVLYETFKNSKGAKLRLVAGTKPERVRELFQAMAF